MEYLCEKNRDNIELRRRKSGTLGVQWVRGAWKHYYNEVIVFYVYGVILKFSIR